MKEGELISFWFKKRKNKFYLSTHDGEAECTEAEVKEILV